MSTNKTSTPKTGRGRPKTLNNEKTIDIAMQEYWLDENNNISLNEICRRAKISKPGLYREFGDEDGLIEAVLLKYEKDKLSKLLNLFQSQKDFEKILDELIFFLTAIRSDANSPKGCLLVKLKDSKIKVGPKSQKQIASMIEQSMRTYANCIDRAKKKVSLKQIFLPNLPPYI